MSCTGPFAPKGSETNRHDVSEVVALSQVPPLAGVPTSAGIVVSALLHVPLTVTFGCGPSRKNGRPLKPEPVLAAEVHCETPAVQGAVTVTSTVSDQRVGSLFDEPEPVARSCNTPPTTAAVHWRFCTFPFGFRTTGVPALASTQPAGIWTFAEPSGGPTTLRIVTW